MAEHPRDDLGAYALGALDADERRAVEAHVSRCDLCAVETERYRAALARYAEAWPAPALPDLRARIVARARYERRPPVARLLAALRRPVPLAVPAALAVLLVVSIAALGAARSDERRYAAALAGVVDGRVVELTPSAQAPDARGALVIPRSGSPYLILRLPAPPPDRVWEAWVLRDGGPVPAGLARAGGVFTLALEAPLTSGNGAAVTLERAGGTQAPTTPPVLAIPRT